jgi:menaquinone-dependent protoporphyrinogen oxidase
MKVLISAASKHGATAGIADAIASELMGGGFEVIVREPGQVDDVDDCDALVVGSAVYAGHWMKSAIEMTQRIAEKLASKPVWLFSSGPIGDPPKPTEDPVDVQQVMELTKAREHRLFAGKLDKALLSFPERAIVGALRAPYGDFRDWGQIQDWAAKIAISLQETAAAGSTTELSRPHELTSGPS